MSSASSLSDYSTPLNRTSTVLPPPTGDAGLGKGGAGLGDTVFLMAVAALGVTLNALVAASLLTMPARGRRRGSAATASAFVIHACLLDAVKCAYCVPFAVTSLQRALSDTSVCDALSRSVKSTIFCNLVAIVTTLQPVKHRWPWDMLGLGLGLVLGLFSASLGPARTRSRMFDRLQRRNNSHGHSVNIHV